MRDALASAPGRVNLIGEHTDYNGGFVLPMPIAQRATVRLRARADRRVCVTSRALAEEQSYELGEERHTGAWLDYVMGCTGALAEAGHAIGGCDLDLASEVPLGSGLSSSAALEIAVLRALREASSLAIDDVALALLGQRAENAWVGAPVGAMDQLAASLGVAGEALFIDMRSLAATRVPLPATLDVVVIASGVIHSHSTGSYRIRREECERAARQLGIELLRDATLADVATLPAPLDRRVRHVVTENARVLAAVDAFARGDTVLLGQLFAASHASMRDDYEVSVPAIDALVALACADPDVIGARLTGGGFGGSIVALARAGRGAVAAQRVCAAYRERVGLEATILTTSLPS
jgi:galactokinase